MTLFMREREKFMEGKAEGKVEGIIKFTLDLGYSEENILSALQETLGINMRQAENYLKNYYKENF